MNIGDKYIGVVQNIRLTANRLKSEIEVFENIATSTSIALQEKVQTSPKGDAIPRVIAEIEDKKESIEQLNYITLELLSQMSMLIGKLSSEASQEVLISRYIRMRSHGMASYELGISKRHEVRVFGRAKMQLESLSDTVVYKRLNDELDEVTEILKNMK